MKLFSGYKKIQRHIALVILAEVCIQLINAGFFLILLIYMQKCGYQDYEGAKFVKFRFLSVLLFAIPVGYFIRGKKIKPLFYASGAIVPVSSLLIIYGVDHHYDFLIYLAQFTWGIGFVGLQTAALPFILRNAHPETVTEAISLSHATWSIAGTFCGLLIFILHNIFPYEIHEREMLYAFSMLGFLALYFVSRIHIEENTNDHKKVSHKEKSYDWSLILKATIPTLIIAVGAGLTIPFISLFFYNVHGIDSDRYSIMAAIALLIVFFATLSVPVLKNRLGYRTAVPLTQSLAIAALIFLALTELIHHTTAGIIIAVCCYMFRQPLMNMAGPMTTEVTMSYVGKKNQEMMSAITASIWSGSWFISAQLFEALRRQQLAYMNIFLITAGLYSVGVIAYMFLIRDFEKRRKLMQE